MAVNARRALKRLGNAAPGRLCAIVDSLELTADRVAQIAGQTDKRLRGEIPDGATRLVSLHDPGARPIRKGRLGKPVEFGYKAQVVDNEDGVSSTTTSRLAIHRMHRCSFRQSSASPAGPSECPKRSPLTVAMARQPSANSSVRSGCAPLFCPPKANRVCHDASLKADRSSSAW